MIKISLFQTKLFVVFVILMLTGPVAKCELPHIIIDKCNLRLYLIENNDTIMNVEVCVGRNYGDKKRIGDCRTPEGNFTICQIQDSQLWQHDFGDGYGYRKGAYGPLFLRLKIPKWNSIGIHGTCFPSSIGSRNSEGCIRLRNDDLLELYKYVSINTKVTILPD